MRVDRSFYASNFFRTILSERIEFFLSLGDNLSQPLGRILFLISDNWHSQYGFWDSYQDFQIRRIVTYIDT